MNLKSEQKERLASWNRFRGTVDIDSGTLVHQQELYFHATAVRQAGAKIGSYLGPLTSPSGMSSGDTFRLDSYTACYIAVESEAASMLLVSTLALAITVPTILWLSR